MMDLSNIVNFDTGGAMLFSAGVFIASVITIAIITFKSKSKSK